MMGRLFAGLISLAVFLSPAVPSGYAQARGEEATARQAAREAAQEWLRHLDAGAWSTAWTAMAPILRDTVTEAQWSKRGTRMRKTLGDVHSRRLVRVQSRDTLRQAIGAGPVFLLRYYSTFEDGLYVETLLLTKAEDTWAVAGYEVAPMAAPANQRREALRKGTSD